MPANDNFRNAKANYYDAIAQFANRNFAKMTSGVGDDLIETASAALDNYITDIWHNNNEVPEDGTWCIVYVADGSDYQEDKMNTGSFEFMRYHHSTGRFVGQPYNDVVQVEHELQTVDLSIALVDGPDKVVNQRVVSQRLKLSLSDCYCWCYLRDIMQFKKSL